LSYAREAAFRIRSYTSLLKWNLRSHPVLQTHEFLSAKRSVPPS